VSDRSQGPRPRVRDQILATTQELIAEGGYAAFTIDALVSASGISKTTVYRWWDNRAHVALDTMHAAYGWPAEPAGDDPISRIRSYLSAEVEYQNGPAGPILRGVFADSQLRPALAETLSRLYLAPRQEAMESLLRAGITGGVLREDLDVPVAALMLSAPLLQTLLGSAAPAPADIADRSVDVLLAGIARPRV
jgi:AcrR family transcriptional regulator